MACYKRGEIMGLFGQSKKEVFMQVASMIEGEFVKGSLFKGHKVISSYNNWDIVLDTYTQSTGNTSTKYTRMRATFLNTSDFKFRLYNNAILSEIGKMLGLQDVIIGDTLFDQKYILKGNDEQKLIEIFSNSKVKELMYEIDRLYLQVKDKDGKFSKYPHDTDILLFQFPKQIRDVEKLKNLFFLFYLLLELFVITGIAVDASPDIIAK